MPFGNQDKLVGPPQVSDKNSPQALTSQAGQTQSGGTLLDMLGRSPIQPGGGGFVGPPNISPGPVGPPAIGPSPVGPPGMIGPPNIGPPPGFGPPGMIGPPAIGPGPVGPPAIGPGPAGPPGMIGPPAIGPGPVGPPDVGGGPGFVGPPELGGSPGGGFVGPPQGGGSADGSGGAGERVGGQDASGIQPGGFVGPPELQMQAFISQLLGMFGGGDPSGQGLFAPQQVTQFQDPRFLGPPSGGPLQGGGNPGMNMGLGSFLSQLFGGR